MTYPAVSSWDAARYRDINLSRDDFDDFVPLALRRHRLPRATTLCAAAAALGASLTLLSLYGPPAPLPGAAPVTVAATAAPAPSLSTSAPATPAGAPLAAMVPLRSHVALFDPTPVEAHGLEHPAPVGLDGAFNAAPIMPPPEDAQRRAAAQASATQPAPQPAPGVQSAALSSDLDSESGAAAAPLPLPMIPAAPGLAEAIPLPAPRPVFRQAALSPVVPTATAPAAPGVARGTTTPAGKPGFFEKVFGGLAATAPAGPALAYANPEDGGGLGGLLGRGLGSRGAPDNLTAVYDIAAHTVTLPDGTRLEAHSGLGAMRDNPYSVTERMRGATPPNVYELTPREAVFHGVRALRLTPVGGTTFGRGGLLAHTFMLGPNGDSNGCVVFRNYKAFLDAYDSGRIRRLAVVARAG